MKSPPCRRSAAPRASPKFSPANPRSRGRRAAPSARKLFAAPPCAKTSTGCARSPSGPRVRTLACRALKQFWGERLFGRDPFTARKPIDADSGFCRLIVTPNAEAALDLYASGLQRRDFPGLTALWSPARRAILRPSEPLRLPSSTPGAGEALRLDADFDRLLALCAAGASPRNSRDDGLLSELFDLGAAHVLELRQGERTVAALIGVASGGVFTVEHVYAANAHALGRAVAALARQLARWRFLAIDFGVWSPALSGLPIEFVSREMFDALLRDAAGLGRHGRWRFDPPAPVAAEQRRAA